MIFKGGRGEFKSFSETDSDWELRTVKDRLPKSFKGTIFTTSGSAKEEKLSLMIFFKSSAGITERSINTINATVTITRINIPKIVEADRAPVLPSSNVVAKALGISATIPENIINDIPFPIPLCVICSPNHIRKTVPATSVITVVNL